MIINYKLKEKALKDVKNKWISLGLILLFIGLISVLFTFLFDLATWNLAEELAIINKALAELDITTEAGMQKFDMYFQNYISILLKVYTYSIITIVGSLIAGSFTFGMTRIFLLVSKGEDFKINNFKDLFVRLKEGIILNLIKSVKIFLWSLLFIIPGIVKTFSYSMAEYIKIEHPEYGYNKALRESERLMYGFKLHLFTFILSFFGWFILVGVVNMVITTVFEPTTLPISVIVNVLTVVVSIPLDIYLSASMANYYTAIKDEKQKYEDFIKKRENTLNIFKTEEQENQKNNEPFSGFSDKEEKPFNDFQSNQEDNDPFKDFK